MTFLKAACKILKEAGRPLHYEKITKIALERGLIETTGATPARTMNAYLSVDIKEKGENSKFYRSKPGYYGVGSKRKEDRQKDKREARRKLDKELGLTPQQKGEIAENRVIELITLYGNEGLSCYRPVADDEGIDIIVKRRKKLDVCYVQVKSSWSNRFVCTVKDETLLNKTRMLLVFVYFDLLEGDLHDQVFCIPAPKFQKLTNVSKNGLRTFRVNLENIEENKFAEFMIEKRELANNICEIMD